MFAQVSAKNVGGVFCGTVYMFSGTVTRLSCVQHVVRCRSLVKV